ncbi:ketoacyl-ACP synthase III [Paenibacillus gansuensis]|uniref:Beta-ketoacyl-[acyl-carrier-protein] synthase III n=1 Tax=Paenibacillus gansuensis TaxID=306542 RepID=A0ABW5PBR2_9BACL
MPNEARPATAATMYHANITAIGTYRPEKVLTNADLEALVETTDEWIVQRTGIRERRIARPDEFTSDLCAAAVRDMVGRYAVEVADVDYIIACTATPDYPFPGVSARLQHALGIAKAGAVDVNATCAGFVYGLQLANALVASGMYRKVLVAAGDTLSKITDYTDRTTCILFGDGAGAVLVERGPEASFLAFNADSDGSGGKHVYRAGLAAAMDGVELEGNGCFVQNGREVYKWAVSTVPNGMAELAASAGLTLADIDWFAPHSANLRMIESICERSGVPLAKTLYSLEYSGNTSSATIPLSLDAAVKDGRLAAGQTLLLYGFGGGLVQAGALMKWNPLAPLRE